MLQLQHYIWCFTFENIGRQLKMWPSVNNCFLPPHLHLKDNFGTCMWNIMYLEQVLFRYLDHDGYSVVEQSSWNQSYDWHLDQYHGRIDHRSSFIFFLLILDKIFHILRIRYHKMAMVFG